MPTFVLRQLIVRRARFLVRWGFRIGGSLCAAVALVFAFFWATTDIPPLQELRARALLRNTRILDRSGQLLYQVPDARSSMRQPVPLRAIPEDLQRATVAVEDASFYSNPGVDLGGVARALWGNVISGRVVGGGSTITQQLARSFLLDPQLAQQPSLERKLREVVLALKLTASLPKDDILALYLNQTYYGGLSYGVEAAALHFFDKPARDLSLAECALLAGLPQAPSRYDPFVNEAAARARQGAVLDAMVRRGVLSPARAEAARAEPLAFRAPSSAMRAPHFVQYVLGQLESAVGPEAAVRGGLTVTTTLDLHLHDAAQAALRRQIALLSTPRGGAPDHQVRNGAVVVIDPRDGAILAMVGSPDFGDQASAGEVNAALALRQPGSAIKPFTYAAALERGYTPATTLLDVPTSFPTREGRPYAPQNYDRANHGPLSLREALATSSNVAAVQTLARVGIPALLEMAARLGITTLGDDAERYGLPLALGSGEVTLLEMTSAYGAFANAGLRAPPIAITAVADASGQPVALPPAPERRRALSPQIAYLLSDILSDRLARLSAFGASTPLDVDRPAAVKTGTSSNWRDNWTIGYTPQRAVGVWVGNVDGQPMEAVTGVTGAGPVWHDVMLVAHRDLPPLPFARPPGISELAICVEGGMLPSPACPGTRLERFLSGSEPTQPDDTHIILFVDPLLDCLAPAGYPPERALRRLYRVVSPAAEAWAASAGVPRPPSRECAVDDAPAGAQARVPLPAPALLAPAPGAVFKISPDIPRERQRIELRAQAGAPVRSLRIIVDGRVVASLDEQPYRAVWRLAPGRHEALVEAVGLDGSTWRSAAVSFDVQP